MNLRLGGCVLLAVLLSVTACRAPNPSDVSATTQLRAADGTGLSDAVVLIIRHAEKPERGQGLSAAGKRRAKAYVEYFRDLYVDSHPLHLDYLVAAADSENSHRPRLTLEPLSKALRLKLDLRFTHQHCEDLAKELRAKEHGKHILICWRHGEMPQLLRALGADPARLLPDAKWPEHEFGWVVQLRYDHAGHLITDEIKRN